MNATTATWQPQLLICLKYTVDNSQPFTPEPLQQQKQTMFLNLIIRIFKSANLKATPVMKHKLKHLFPSKSWERSVQCAHFKTPRV